MTELKLARGAAIWLRRLGLAVFAMLASAGLALLGLLGANANQDLGWDSKVD